jgi:hypothetical protein
MYERDAIAIQRDLYAARNSMIHATRSNDNVLPPALRESMTARIRELEAELVAAVRTTRVIE